MGFLFAYENFFRYLILTPFVIFGYSIFFFLHEIGHGLMANLLLKDKHWKVTVGKNGLGQLLKETKRFRFNRNLFTCSLMTGTTNLKGNKFRKVMVCMGGVIANAFLVIVFILLSYIAYMVFDRRTLWLDAANLSVALNITIAAVSLFPHKRSYGMGRGLPSDGLAIIKLLLNPDENHQNQIFNDKGHS